MTNNVVFCIWLLDDDSIVAGLKYGGIVHFSREDTQALNLTEKDGLSNNTVNSIAQYDDNILWLGTYKGITKYNYVKHTLESINSFNNIQKSDYNNSDITVESQDENAILTESIAYSNKLILKHNQNNFSLDFTSLKFPFADNVSYSYKLEGYNDFWTSLKNSNHINFSNIPPGNYNLKIAAASDVESSYYKEFEITILPPFWKTIPAYIFYIITTLILITTGLRYYSERIKLKNSLLLKKTKTARTRVKRRAYSFLYRFFTRTKNPSYTYTCSIRNLT